MLSGETRGRGGGALARHLCNQKNGQHVQLLVARHLAGADLALQVRELVAGAGGGGTDRPVWHVHVDPPLGFDRPDVIRHWLQLFEREFGLDHQPRAGVLHSGKGGSERLHGHFLYSLVRRDGHVIDLRNSYRRREKVSVIVAAELGLPVPPVPRPRAIHRALLRDGRTDVAAWFANNNPDLFRPLRIANTTPRERLIGERTGISPAEIAATVGDAWTASGPFAFRRQLARAGLLLAMGDKGPVIVDQSGAVHSVTRVVRKACRASGQNCPKAADVRHFLDELHLPPLNHPRKLRSDMSDRKSYKRRILAGITGEKIVAEFQDRTRFVRTGPPHHLFMHDGSKVLVDPARRRLIASRAGGDAENLAKALAQIEPYEVEIGVASQTNGLSLSLRAVRPGRGTYRHRLEWWRRHGQNPELQDDGIVIEVAGTRLVDRGNEIDVALPPSDAALDLVAQYAADHWGGGLVLDGPPGAQDWPSADKARLWWACREKGVVFHGYNPRKALLKRWEEEHGSPPGGIAAVSRPHLLGNDDSELAAQERVTQAVLKIASLQKEIDEIKGQYRYHGRDQDWIENARRQVDRLEDMKRELQYPDGSVVETEHTTSRRLA